MLGKWATFEMKSYGSSAPAEYPLMSQTGCARSFLQGHPMIAALLFDAEDALRDASPFAPTERYAAAEAHGLARRERVAHAAARPAALARDDAVDGPPGR